MSGRGGGWKPNFWAAGRLMETGGTVAGRKRARRDMEVAPATGRFIWRGVATGTVATRLRDSSGGSGTTTTALLWTPADQEAAVDRYTALATAECWRTALWSRKPRNAVVAAARLRLHSAAVALQRSFRRRRLRRLRADGVVCPITQEAIAYPAVVLWHPGPPAARTFLNAAAFYDYARATGRFADPVTRRDLSTEELAAVDEHMRTWGLVAAAGGTALASLAADPDFRARLELEAERERGREAATAGLRMYTEQLLAGEAALHDYIRIARLCLVSVMFMDPAGFPRARALSNEAARRLRAEAEAEAAAEGGSSAWCSALLSAANALSLDAPFVSSVRSATGGPTVVFYPSLLDEFRNRVVAAAVA